MIREPKNEDFVGKTIASVNFDFSNVWQIKFTDGTDIEILVECAENSKFPYLYVDNGDFVE